MAKPCPTAPALPLPQLWEGLNRNCLSGCNLRARQESEEFCDLRFRAPQIFFIADWARAELGIEIAIGGLMRDFNCSRHAVQSALANGLNEPKSRGRDIAESDANILAWIKRKAEKSTEMTRTDIRN
jgi:hypothetical protein